MRCFLPRPYIRWLQYMTVLAIVLFLFSHGLVILSQRKRGLYSVDFDNVNAINEDDSEVRVGVLQQKYQARAQLGPEFEDYDSDGESFKNIRAHVNIEQDLTQHLDKHDLDASKRTTMSDVLRKWISGEDNRHLSGKNQSANIIINSYGIRKATVLDELFVNKPEAIIFYQPSLHLRSYWYLRGDNQLCSMKSSSCGLAGKDAPLLVLKCLIGLFQCSTEALATCLGPLGVVTHPDVARYNECKKKAKTEDERKTCMRMLHTMCTSAKVKVISVRNVALDVLEYVLSFIQNIKIIHIFRDARPIIYSEKTRATNLLSTSGDNIFNRAQSLCNRTKYDLEIASDLEKRETTDKFQMIVQEKLLNNHVEMSNMFSMKVTEEYTVYDVIESGVKNVISKHSDMDKTWRLNMDINAISVAYDICKNIYGELGYRLV